MTRTQAVGSPMRRARRMFWILVGMAVLAAGALSSGLAAASSPFTGLRVASSGIVLVVALTLATRILVRVERARRRVGGGRKRPKAPIRVQRRHSDT